MNKKVPTVSHRGDFFMPKHPVMQAMMNIYIVIA